MSRGRIAPRGGSSAETRYPGSCARPGDTPRAAFLHHAGRCRLGAGCFGGRLRGGPERVSKEIISTDGAPAAIGPYSQAVRCGRLLFVSGQIPLDPATGSMVAGGIVEQTDRVLRNLAAVIEAGGGCLLYTSDAADD